MFCDFDQCNEAFDVRVEQRQRLVACGYDPTCYIAAGKLTSSPYVTQDLITAKLGGLVKLIEACDDQQPPSGDFNDSGVQNVYNTVIQAVVTEINGYLSSIYPIPLVQTNTIAAVKVTGVDSTGLVTSIESVAAGNYLGAPNGGNADNIVPAGTNYSGIGNHNLTGLTVGATYKYTPGVNETGTFMNGTNSLTGEQTFVCMNGIVELFGNDINIPITAIVQAAFVNTPAYLRYLDPLANEDCFGNFWLECQKGKGLTLAVIYDTVPYSDENGTTINTFFVDGTPTIVLGGANYQVNDILVLTTGTSVVPAKIREATLDLICHTLYKRRLAPDEKNPFSTLAKMWREMLVRIGDGELELDGTFKRSFSIGAMWGARSICNSNSL